MKKAFGTYSCYSLKVLIGAIILIVVAIATTPGVFREKFRNRLSQGD